MVFIFFFLLLTVHFVEELKPCLNDNVRILHSELGRYFVDYSPHHGYIPNLCLFEYFPDDTFCIPESQIEEYRKLCKRNSQEPSAELNLKNSAAISSSLEINQ
eukprot:Sdes_comp24987_c0_seq1m22627